MSVSSAERDLREQARLLVRAGVLDPAAQRAALVDVVRVEMPDTDAEIMSRAWLAAAARDLGDQARSWPEVTDHDRLVGAFEECARNGVPFLVGESDLHAVRMRAEAAAVSGTPLRGIGWFDEPAIWQAITSGVLESGLRHGDGRTVEAGDQLAAAVVGCLAQHGVQARVVEGTLHIATHWQRRP